MAPLPVGAVAEIARGEGEDRLDVVAADDEHESDAASGGGRERGKERRACGIRDRGEADRGVLGRVEAACEMADRRGHRSRCRRAQPLGSQIGNLGH